jgi:hypothetical protein
VVGGDTNGDYDDEEREDSRNTSEEDGLESSANGTFINHSVVLNEGEEFDTFVAGDSDYLQAL